MGIPLPFTNHEFYFLPKELEDFFAKEIVSRMLVIPQRLQSRIRTVDSTPRRLSQFLRRPVICDQQLLIRRR